MRQRDEDRIVTEIGHCFATFGGGQRNDTNPVAAWTKDKPLMFALGVDVRAVVQFVIAASRKARRARGRKTRAA